MTVDNKRGELPSLGVVAISYNEERDLPEFITNLESWADEIVIVDDGSTDKTESIANAAGNKVNFIVSPRQKSEYFSHQRNKGIDAAESDWLLHMDIDERVTPELASEILKSIQNSDMDAYRYRRLNFFFHRPMRGGGWQDWNLVHLARREVFRFGGMFHEDCIVDTSLERIGQLESKMWHLNDESYLERMTKSNLYCQEQAARIKERNIRVHWWHMILIPGKEFIKKYFVRAGYKDGLPGFVFALHSTAAMFKASVLVWDDQNRISRQDIEDELKQKWFNSSEFGQK